MAGTSLRQTSPPTPFSDFQTQNCVSYALNCPEPRARESERTLKTRQRQEWEITPAMVCIHFAQGMALLGGCGLVGVGVTVGVGKETLLLATRKPVFSSLQMEV